MTGSVVVAVSPRGPGRGSAHDLALRLLASCADLPSATLTWRQLCPRCGSSSHGAPVSPVPGWWLGISRDADHEVAVVTALGPVGIDHERMGRLRVEQARPLIAAPGELPAGATDADATRLWVRKEAVLKAAGLGLTVPAHELALGPADAPLAGRERTGVPRVRLRWGADLDLDPGIVAAVAITGPGALLDPDEVVLRRLDEERSHSGKPGSASR